MCTVSNIGDWYGQHFPQKWPQFYPVPQSVPPKVTAAEFEALRAEVRELKKLLEMAKKFDGATGQPNCEMAEKIKLIKAIAKLVGVELGDVFQPTTKTIT